MSTTVPRRPLVRPSDSVRRHRGGRSHLRGRVDQPSWAWPALIGLLIVTAAAYVWDLSASGNANSLYAAAVQAGTRSWKALFFGSLDTSSFITVDKPPASLWVMALSGRIFGFSSLSMLVPQALEGVATVALLYAAVKRWFGPGAGLMAGALMAITPVAALMFRFNNPDALLVMLLVAGAYCLVRALEGASTRWILAVGAMIGLAFLAKMMQAFLVLPAFALAYLVAAPTGLRRRVLQLCAGGLTIVVSAGWWVAIVALWPSGSRPMIDGSPTNDIFNLITGYNGLGRIFGASGPGGGGGGANFSGSTGVLRLFNSAMGGQASWLLPGALLAIAVGLWSRRRGRRTDRSRAAVLLWGGWLLVSGIVFSLSSGIIHTYYTVALAPAISALVAITAVRLWREREQISLRVLLATGVGVTAGWSWVLLDRTPQWDPWLRAAIAVSAVLAIAGVLAAPALRRLGRAASMAIPMLAFVACLAGPGAYSAQTITTDHTGSIPSAGPSSGSPGGPGGGGAGGGGAFGGGSTTSGALVTALTSGAGQYRWVAAVSGSQSAASLELATNGAPVMAIGGFDNEGGNLSLAQFKHYVARGEIHYYIVGGARGGGRFAPTRGGSAPAGIGVPPAGARQPTSGGQRPAGAFGRDGGSNSAITTWVKAHYKSETIGAQTVYNLAARASA